MTLVLFQKKLIHKKEVSAATE